MKHSYIDIKEFDYSLPAEKIAKYPLEQRSQSKLLFYKAGNIEHHSFIELPNLLPESAMLVFNNTKVIEARLYFKKETGAEIEVFLLNPANPENATDILQQKGKTVWKCMIGNKKRWKLNDILHFHDENKSLTAHWKDRENDLVEFHYSGDVAFIDILHELGSLPIPPYLNRPTEKIDLTRYQTTFAELSGSVAAPTAALHFDESIYLQLNKKNITCQYLTLHVAAGTFKPGSVENAMEHPKQEEYIIYSKEFIYSIINHNGPIIAVGTTSLRSLESLYWFGVGIIKKTIEEFKIQPFFTYSLLTENISVIESMNAILQWMEDKNLSSLQGFSSIYIVPGYQAKMANGIITNFHQPQSTLLLLVCALVGNDWKKIYQNALENNYRFLSYGDSSLLMF